MFASPCATVRLSFFWFAWALDWWGSMVIHDTWIFYKRFLHSISLGTSAWIYNSGNDIEQNAFPFDPRKFFEFWKQWWIFTLNASSIQIEVLAFICRLCRKYGYFIRTKKHLPTSKSDRNSCHRLKKHQPNPSHRDESPTSLRAGCRNTRKTPKYTRNNLDLGSIKTRGDAAANDDKSVVYKSPPPSWSDQVHL